MVEQTLRLAIVEEEVKTKSCSRCKSVKPISEFCKDIYNRNGLSCQCRECRNSTNKEWVINNRDRWNAISSKSYFKNIDVRKSRALKKKYGVTLDELNSMKEERGNRCDICGGVFVNDDCTGLHVDHCHNSGVVRGLLCGSCNRAIGMLKDNVGLLEKSIQYLNDGTVKGIICTTQGPM